MTTPLVSLVAKTRLRQQLAEHLRRRWSLPVPSQKTAVALSRPSAFPLEDIRARVAQQE